MSFFNFLFGKPEKPFKKNPDHVGCDFGHKVFNKSKRSKRFVEEINTTTRKSTGGGKPPKQTGGGGSTNTPGVLLLDFNGHLVSSTSWNYNGDINCQYSGLTNDEQQLILTAVQEDYAPFNIIVTTDEQIFNATPQNKRMRCIITETWEWYGQAGGVAFVGSYSWADETPCFVFSSLLGYNTKYIQEAISHELGHTLGLYHQSSYDTNCIKLSEYNTGCCGEAPIMGVAYYQPIGKWWVGPNSYGCTSIQDDFNIIKSKAGIK